MTNWPSRGAVRDLPSERNFRELRKRGGELERELRLIEEKGLPPTGKVGGVLKGELPNPEFAKEPAYKAELENETTARKEVDKILKEEIEAEEAAREGGDAERVVGPGSAKDGDIAVYDGATGKKVKDGGKSVAEVLARENHTGTQLASTISNFDTQVRTSRLDQMAAPGADVSWASKKITDLLDPTEAEDAANKSYVDAAASAAAAGLTFKAPVAYATTAALTVSKATEKTLEGTTNLGVDGETAFEAGIRLLLKNQVVEAQNGIYVVTEDRAFGASGKFGGEGKFGEGKGWLLTRASDADTEAEVQRGMYVPVTQGAVNGGTAWTLSTENPIIIGTTAQAFTPFTATPGGSAGGDLTGTYPNPTVKEGAISSAKIETGAIVNADVNAGAAIKYSKLALEGKVKSSDVEAASLEDADLASPNNSVYKTICVANRPFNTDLGAGTYFLAYNTGITSQSGGNQPNQTLPFFYFAAADYAVSGKTTELRTRAQVGVNATKALMNFTIGMYPITFGGGVDELKITAGTVVSGSTVAINQPNANSLTQGNSGDFTIPADGAYALAVVTSATLTNNSAVLISAQLQVRNT